MLLFYLDKYDSSNAILNRSKILRTVCNEYKDILNVEYDKANGGKVTEERRLYSNNLSFTFCGTDLGHYYVLAKQLFQDIINAYKISSLDTLNPCEAKKIHDLTTRSFMADNIFRTLILQKQA